MPEHARIRPVTAQDQAAVEALVHAVLREHGLEPDPAQTDHDLKDPKSFYMKNGGCFDVLEADGRLLGCVALLPRDGMRVELRKMYLAPEARGHGLGRRLLEHALTRARQKGFRRVELETASALAEARRLYLAYGFQLIPATGSLASRCDQRMALDLESEATH